MIAALLIYSLALLAFAGDYAFGRPRRKAAMLAASARRGTGRPARGGRRGVGGRGVGRRCARRVGAGRVRAECVRAGVEPAAPGAAARRRRSRPDRRVRRAAGAAGRRAPRDRGGGAVGPRRRHAQRARHPCARGRGHHQGAGGAPRPVGRHVRVHHRADLRGRHLLLLHPGQVPGLGDRRVRDGRDRHRARAGRDAHLHPGRAAGARAAVLLAVHPRHRDDAVERHLLRRRRPRHHVPGRRAVPEAGRGREGRAQPAARPHPERRRSWTS